MSFRMRVKHAQLAKPRTFGMMPPGQIHPVIQYIVLKMRRWSATNAWVAQLVRSTQQVMMRLALAQYAIPSFVRQTSM
jgi:hypothetical protein